MKKYKIIYADHPWNFKVWSNKGKDRSAENHYKIMNTQDIKNLNVKEISDKDCILFLWATYPNLKEALEVIESWGFQYKTVAFTWIKLNKGVQRNSDGSDELGGIGSINDFFMGLGYWTRANPEICLLATKGKPMRKDKGVRNLTISQLREHSSKPLIIRKKIVKLMGNIQRIELFAREKTKGWDAWGNEIDSDIKMKTKQLNEVLE